jgi:serine/threonine protein phosphatase PrpC
LCSDGLHGAIGEREIARIVLKKNGLDELARVLVEYAVEVDGSDNTTAQVIRVHAVEAMAMYRGRLYPRQGA